MNSDFVAALLRAKIQDATTASGLNIAAVDEVVRHAKTRFVVTETGELVTDGGDGLLEYLSALRIERPDWFSHSGMVRGGARLTPTQRLDLANGVRPDAHFH